MNGFGQWTYSSDDYLDKGGCATIYRCHKKNDRSKSFAIKVFKNKTSFNMLEREVSILEALKDIPNTPNILDHGVDDEGRICIVQDLLYGDSLDGYIRDHGPLSYDQMYLLVDKVLTALKGAHQLGIVHLDIKPGNIMVDWPNITLLDWGVSQRVGARITDSFGGNDYYASPEIYYANFSPASDFYALGWVINYCFTARKPYQFNDINNDHYIPIAHCVQSPEISDAVPEKLHPLIYQWLNKNPTKRHIYYRFDDAINLAGGSRSDFAEETSIDQTLSTAGYLEYGARANIPYCQLKYAEYLIEQKNILEAGYWLHCAHNRKYIPATNAIVRQRVKDEGLYNVSESTIKLLIYAANNKDYRSTCYLTRIYLDKGDRQNIEAITKLLQRAANEGYSDALYLLAKIFLQIHEKPSEAKRYFTKAAQRGHTAAKKMLSGSSFNKTTSKTTRSIVLSL